MSLNKLHDRNKSFANEHHIFARSLAVDDLSPQGLPLATDNMGFKTVISRKLTEDDFDGDLINGVNQLFYMQTQQRTIGWFSNNTAFLVDPNDVNVIGSRFVTRSNLNLYDVLTLTFKGTYGSFMAHQGQLGLTFAGSPVSWGDHANNDVPIVLPPALPQDALMRPSIQIVFRIMKVKQQGLENRYRVSGEVICSNSRNNVSDGGSAGNVYVMHLEPKQLVFQTALPDQMEIKPYITLPSTSSDLTMTLHDVQFEYRNNRRVRIV
jgi:hypothetical protein